MKKQYPNLIRSRYLSEPETHGLVKGKWLVPRPICYPSITTRFKLAWKVFTGEYDALKWDDRD